MVKLLRIFENYDLFKVEKKKKKNLREMLREELDWFIDRYDIKWITEIDNK